MESLKKFAVVKKATGKIETIGDTNFSDNLQRDFPGYSAAEYEFHDMTEKGRFPEIDGADIDDFEIDSATGEYKLVTLLVVVSQRFKTSQKIVVQELLVDLHTKKDKAQVLGYTDLVTDLQRRIDDLEAELQALEKT